LVWSKYKYTPEIEAINLNVDTEMTWAYPATSLDRINLYDLYKINYSWPVNGTLAGHWTYKEGIIFSLTQYKYDRRKDLRGIVYKAALVVSITYNISSIVQNLARNLKNLMHKS
jgi:hypothetical protein